jgi:hypothetical protein
MPLAKFDREIDRLFELPLDEFTSSRNELARRLKREGDKEAAEQVQAFAKPSVPVWTINQLARQEKDRVKALLDAGAKLRKAQEGALAGGRSDALRASQAEERQVVRDLTQRAEKLMKSAGLPAGRANLERISTTLGAAAVTESARDALKAGRLTEEISVTGFDALAGLDLPKRRAAHTDELAERRRKKANTEQDRRRVEKRARELEALAERSERTAARHEDTARKARAKAEQDRAAADAAAADLAEFDA